MVCDCRKRRDAYKILSAISVGASGAHMQMAREITIMPATAGGLANGQVLYELVCW